MITNQLSYKVLIKHCQTNKEYTINYLLELYNKYNPLFQNIKITKPLLSLMSFVPLPYEFQTEYLGKTDAVKKENNIYTFTGESGDRILFANRRIPSCEQDSVPFTLPIRNNKDIELIQSNIFYYEITILNKILQKQWDSECLSIGFGTSKTLWKNQVGWTEESWGIHSDDGCLMNYNKTIKITEPWSLGDTVGIGLIYDKKYEYRLLFTKNGKIIEDEYVIKTKNNLYPMIGLDLSSPIFVNWGQQDFNFNLKSYINSNKIINNKITFLTDNIDISEYKYTPPNYTKFNIIKKKDDIKEVNINNIFKNGKAINIQYNEPSTKILNNNTISSINNLKDNSNIFKLGVNLLKDLNVNETSDMQDFYNKISPNNITNYFNSVDISNNNNLLLLNENIIEPINDKSFSDYIMNNYQDIIESFLNNNLLDIANSSINNNSKAKELVKSMVKIIKDNKDNKDNNKNDNIDDKLD